MSGLDALVDTELKQFVESCAVALRYLVEGSSVPQRVENVIKKRYPFVGEKIELEAEHGESLLHQTFSHLTAHYAFDKHFSLQIIGLFTEVETRVWQFRDRSNLWRVYSGHKSEKGLLEKIAKWTQGRNIEHSRMRIIVKDPSSPPTPPTIKLPHKGGEQRKGSQKTKEDSAWRTYKETHEAANIAEARKLADWISSPERPWDIIAPFPQHRLWTDSDRTYSVKLRSQVISDGDPESLYEPIDTSLYRFEKVEGAIAFMDNIRRKEDDRITDDIRTQVREAISKQNPYARLDDLVIYQDGDKFCVAARNLDTIVDIETEVDIMEEDLFYSEYKTAITNLFGSFASKKKSRVSVWDDKTQAEIYFEELESEMRAKIETLNQPGRKVARVYKVKVVTAEDDCFIVRYNGTTKLYARIGNVIIEDTATSERRLGEIKTNIKRLYGKRTPEARERLTYQLFERVHHPNRDFLDEIKLQFEDLPRGWGVMDRTVDQEEYNRFGLKLDRTASSVRYEDMSLHPKIRRKGAPFDSQINIDVVFRGKKVEIQLRTPEWHYQCEDGKHKHDKYKTTGTTPENTRAELLLNYLGQLHLDD
jgi:hypothetical protein